VPLIMVVCREITADTGAKPRIVRFVVDNAGTAPVTLPVTPRTL
jgi:hypothetical protein